MNASRRDFLKVSLGAAGTILLPGQTFLQAAEPTGDPHFFLMIVLNGGADSSYMFDARPLSMTQAHKIQNYLGRPPAPWAGRNGTAALATSLTKPLAGFRDRFSILNGVLMTPSFDGHLQNMNFLFTGNPFGGDSFVPHLNLAETGREPQSLDSIMSTDSVVMSVNNHSGVVPLHPGSVGGLTATLKQVEPLEAGSELSDHIRGRMTANSTGPGRMAAATRQMLSGLDLSPRVHRQLARLSRPWTVRTPEQQTMALIAECFRLSISRSAIYVPTEFFDVHAAEKAKEQPKLFADAIVKIAALLQGLAETPFDKQRSMFDVTTVMVASEFGRTLRGGDSPIDDTGTHHNQYSNSILIGGKGIRGGLVIGASDLAHETEEPSQAHLSCDPMLEKSMGRPFDFATLRPRPDMPEVFNLKDYLTIGSVVNTIYALFGVPKDRYRVLRRDLPVAPALHGLLS
ncbi:MAG: hypothetical protein QOG83_2497 [Alphaproteobacteria bacterium]|nr:hypothetical protein [Alphaproteobacteria bacterium]